MSDELNTGIDCAACSDNYGDAISKFSSGYTKSVILDSVTVHSLEILDDSIDRVKQGLNTIVSAFEEMRATSESTAGNTRLIDGMMAEILAKNGSMNSGIAQRMGEIESAAQNAKSIASLFEDLKAKSDQVSGITGSIQDVSDRTGILAINASIEAARAGTVGRGFRIIANEVRNLAIQTGDFAKQIETNIGEFQTSVDSINRQMASFLDLFSRFKSSFSEILETFSENAVSIDNAGQSLAQITGSIREEAQALNEGLVSLERVNDSMSDTHAVLGVITKSHEELEQLFAKGSD